MQSDLQRYLKESQVSLEDLLGFLHKYPLLTDKLDLVKSFEDLQDRLVHNVDIAMREDMGAFFQTLYQIDIPEHVTKNLLYTASSDPAQAFAHMILERIRIKILTRRFYKTSN